MLAGARGCMPEGVGSSRGRQRRRRPGLPVVSAGCGVCGRPHGMRLLWLHRRRGKPANGKSLRYGLWRKQWLSARSEVCTCVRAALRRSSGISLWGCCCSGSVSCGSGLCGGRVGRRRRRGSRRGSQVRWRLGLLMQQRTACWRWGCCCSGSGGGRRRLRGRRQCGRRRWLFMLAGLQPPLSVQCELFRWWLLCLQWRPLLQRRLSRKGWQGRLFVSHLGTRCGKGGVCAPACGCSTAVVIASWSSGAGERASGWVSRSRGCAGRWWRRSGSAVQVCAHLESGGGRCCPGGTASWVAPFSAQQAQLPGPPCWRGGWWWCWRGVCRGTTQGWSLVRRPGTPGRRHAGRQWKCCAAALLVRAVR